MWVPILVYNSSYSQLECVLAGSSNNLDLFVVTLSVMWKIGVDSSLCFGEAGNKMVRQMLALLLPALPKKRSSRCSLCSNQWKVFFWADNEVQLGGKLFNSTSESMAPYNVGSIPSNWKSQRCDLIVSCKRLRSLRFWFDVTYAAPNSVSMYFEMIKDLLQNIFCKISTASL